MLEVTMLQDENNKENVGEEGLVTNFHKDQLPIYQRAVKCYGEENLFISQDAYDINGTPIPDCCSLRKRYKSDLSKFWEIFNSMTQ